MLVTIFILFSVCLILLTWTSTTERLLYLRAKIKIRCVTDFRPHGRIPAASVTYFLPLPSTTAQRRRRHRHPSTSGLSSLSFHLYFPLLLLPNEVAAGTLAGSSCAVMYTQIDTCATLNVIVVEILMYPLFYTKNRPVLLIVRVIVTVSKSMRKMQLLKLRLFADCLASFQEKLGLASGRLV